jgi:hypothetical protein
MSLPSLLYIINTCTISYNDFKKSSLPDLFMTSKVMKFISNWKLVLSVKVSIIHTVTFTQITPSLQSCLLYFIWTWVTFHQVICYINLKFKHPPQQQPAHHKATRNNTEQSSSLLKPSDYSMYNQVWQVKLYNLVTLCSSVFFNSLTINSHYFPTHHYWLVFLISCRLCSLWDMK